MQDPSLAAARGYRVGEYTLELARHRLVDPDGAAVPLPGRAYDVLAYLVEHRDRVVGKDELIKAVWPNVIVEDNNLNQAISTVRKALGDSRDAPRYIVTIAGRGYRYVGDAVPLTEAAGEAVDVAPGPIERPLTAGPPASATSRRTVIAGIAVAAIAAAGGGLWWTLTRRPAPLQSIAVLPFKPLLPEHSNPALELGVTELLINRLSRVPGFVVTPMSSVQRYAAPGTDAVDAGRSLGVDAVVDGNLLIQGDRVRLTARLVSVDGGAALWANSFTEHLGELLAVQDSLTIQIANAVTAELSPETRARVLAANTADVEAWQLFVNGRYQLDRRNESGARRAIALFESALARDARFAAAAAGLSDAHAVTAVFGVEPTAKAWERARQAALRAVELDPGLPSAHVSLGHAATQFDRDLAAGRRHYDRALELDARHAPALAWTALNLLQSGDVAGAAEFNRRAQQLEPGSLAFLAQSGWVSYFQRDFAETERVLSRIVESAPDAELPRHFLAHTLLVRQQGAQVLRLLDGRSAFAPTALSTLGRAHAQVGNVEAARAEIRRLESLAIQGFGVAYSLALIHLDLGEREKALDALERGVSDHSQMQLYLNVEPALDPIRAEPRFRAVSKRLGLG